jgi:hypothetical protein
VRAASSCCDPSSSEFQPGSPPSRCALSDESAANGERPASISASTRSSVRARGRKAVEGGGIATRGSGGLCRHRAPQVR